MEITTSEPEDTSICEGIENCLLHTMYRERGTSAAIVIIGDAAPKYDPATREWKNASFVDLRNKKIVPVWGSGWKVTDMERLPDGFELTFTQKKK